MQSTRVWFAETFKPLQLVLEDSKIIEIAEHGKYKSGVDYANAMILPGLIDIHAHGYYGNSCNHATADWLAKWMAYLPTEGVTGVLATTSSVEEKTLLSSMEVIAKAMDKPLGGAQILGINAEGPLLNPTYKGAQALECLALPSPAIIDKYRKATSEKLRYLCIAVEMDEDLKATKYAYEKGISIAIGHSDASLSLCKQAMKAGASSFVHTFNAMPPLNHRNPGPVGAAMYLEEAYAEVIGDGLHVDFSVVNILGKLKGKDRLILVSDSANGKGLPAGDYKLPGRHIVMGEDGTCRLFSSDTLAGGTGKMNEMLYNLIYKAKLDQVAAINAATCNPLQMLGLAKEKGYLKVGYDADITILDKDFSVLQTFVQGIKQL